MINLRETLRYFNQNLLQNSTWETPTRTARPQRPEQRWKVWTQPASLPGSTQSQLAGRSQEHSPSQASSRGHSKGDAQGSHTHYQAILNERGAAAMPMSLKMTSIALGFKAMGPFDWTKDKATRDSKCGQKRHALEAIEGDSEKTKISYFHHWIDGKGMGKIESWRNKKILISQEDYDKLEEDEKEGKYFSEKIESYFTLFELLLAPKSNPLLAVEELCFAKQGSMDSGEFHAHVVKIAKRCKFLCTKA